MNYEVAYNEVLESAKKVLLDCTPEERNVVESIFPSLKELDDDKIKMWLIAQLEIQLGENTTLDNLILKAIAWIKKHAEQDPTVTDRVESKFKVGDWIASEGLNTALIVNIDDDKYEVEYIDGDKGFLHIEYVDRYYHLWSIRDAENGDVLVSLSKMHPFIFNGHYDEDTDYVYAYCGISDIIKDDSFYFDKYPDEEFKVWDLAENVKPATRDQRNLLFSKMKDSGYEWDAENKDLKSHYKCIVTKDSRKGSGD